jgi:hypothetical protein
MRYRASDSLSIARPFRFSNAAPAGFVRPMHVVEVLVLNVLGSRVFQRELIDRHAPGLAKARLSKIVWTIDSFSCEFAVDGR